MGNVEIGILDVSVIFVTVLAWSFTFHLNLVQNAESDWLPGRHKRINFWKYSKTILISHFCVWGVGEG